MKKASVKAKLPQDNWDVLRAMWDETDKSLQQQRYPDQDDFKQAEKRMGRGMWHTELVRKISGLNSGLWVEDSYANPGHAGFYWLRDGKKAYTGAAFKKGFVPEFAVIHTDTADLPTGYLPGWRTVLVRLLKSRAITYRQMLEVFGEVYHVDARGKHWHLWVKDFQS